MAGKLVSVAWIVGGVIIAYLLLTLFMPILVDTSSTANVTMAATSNMSNYPGTTETIISVPWVLYFVPAIGGGIALVVVLRRRP